MIYAVSLFFGALIFLFVFWRRLKDDFASEEIFKVAFVSLGLTFMLGIAATVYARQWFFWSSIIGLFIGGLIGVRKYKMYPAELAEAIVQSSLPLLLIVSIAVALVTNQVEMLFISMVIVLLMILFVIFDKYYKDFSWYKSGKVGFAGLATSCLFFALRAAIAYINADMLSFVPAVDVIISSVAALMFLIALVILARKS